MDPITKTPTGVDTDITISQNYAAPRASSAMEMVLNLDANAEVGSSYSTSLSLYDRLGNMRTLTATFTKNAANTWTLSGTLDGMDITALISDQEAAGPRT